MGKRSNLYEIYFGPIGGHTEYDKLKNGPRGSTHSTGDPLQLDAEFEDEYELDDDFDEEDVDADEAAGETRFVGVECDHGGDGERAQAVNVGATRAQRRGLADGDEDLNRGRRTRRSRVRQL